MDSMCTKCKYKCLPWSESLRDQWVGCGVTLTGTTPPRVDDVINGIEAKTVAMGWVTNGIMAFNDQILTEDTRSCDFFKSK